MRPPLCCLPLAALLAWPAAAAAATLERPPYLQRLSSGGVVVRWRTVEATATRLDWGVVPGAPTESRLDPALATEHRVALVGLLPETTYYYLAGSDTEWLAGGDADHRFRTAPAPGAARPLRLWAIGDPGEASAGQADVRDAYLADAAGAATDVWLLLGDNAYDSGTDAQYTQGLFTPYAGLLREAVAWPVYGNHDALSSDATTLTGPYFDSFSLPRAAEAGGLASATEAFYSFDWGPLHVVALDSAESSLDADAPMLEWLAADLAANRRPWTIAAVHHPPYTKGTHDSDDPADSGGRMAAVRANLLPLLEAQGVDLVLSGHSHDYERSFLVDGHYGDSVTFDPATMRLDGGDGDPAGDGPYVKAAGPHGGTVYVVTGSAARVGPGPLDHPAMAIGVASFASLVVEIDGDRLTARCLDDQGVELDRFVLIEPGVPLFADDFELGSLARWAATGS